MESEVPAAGNGPWPEEGPPVTPLDPEAAVQAITLGGILVSGGAAAGKAIVTGAMGALSRKVAARFLAPERETALVSVVQEALARSLATMDVNAALAEPAGKAFVAWSECPAVHQEVAGLLYVTPSEPDAEALWVEWRLAGADAFIDRLAFDRFLASFVIHFANGAARRAELAPALSCSLLGEIARTLSTTQEAAAQTTTNTGRAADATEQVARTLTEILEAIQRLSVTRLEVAEWLRNADTRDPRIAAEVYRLVRVGLERITDSSLPGAEDPSDDLKELLNDLRTRLLDLPDADLPALEAAYRSSVFNVDRLDYGSIDGRPVAVELNDVYIDLPVVKHLPERDAFDIEERRALAQAASGEEKPHPVLVGKGGRRGRFPLQHILRRKMEANIRAALAQLSEEQRVQVQALGEEKREQGVRRAEAARLAHLTRLASTERFRLDAVLASTPRLVLLGDPGSGKSTALRHHLLRQLDSETLPVLAPLAAYDEFLKTAPKADIFAFLETFHDEQRLQPGLGPLFRRRFLEGRLVLLLDGLDEVVERTTRTYVAQQVAALLDVAARNGSHVVVTSRFVGYQEAPVRGVPTYAVVDLSISDIEVFVARFSVAVQRVLVDDVATALARAEAARADLMRDVRSKAGVRELAGNPLLLSQLALLRREVGTLPDRRVHLYDRFLNKLLVEWRHLRSRGAVRSAVLELDTNRTLDILMTLALDLHQRWASGTAPGAVVYEVLTQALRDWGEAHPREEATRLLHDVRRRAGVLVERGHDSYGFLHLTFEEYLAGRALARMKPDTCWEFLAPRLHDPRWREPLFLAFGWIKSQRDDEAGDLVARVLEAGSEDEELLHRDLFLAADLAGEDGGRLPRIRAELTRRLATLLDSGVSSVRHGAAARLGALGRAGSSGAVQVLCERLQSGRDSATRRGVARYLSAPACRGIRDVFRNGLEDVTDHEVPQLLATTLDTDEEDLAALVRWLKQQQAAETYTFVWNAIAQHIIASDGARSAVLAELRDPGGELVLPDPDALRDDPELCDAVFLAWVSKGGHSHETLARELGLLFRARGISASDVLGPIRALWPGSGNLLPALEAYATDPEIRSFLWDLNDGEEAIGAALLVLTMAASADDADRMVRRLDQATGRARLAWMAAVAQLPGRSDVVRRLVADPLPEVRAAAVASIASTCTTAEISAWLRDPDGRVREALLPELTRRSSDPAVRRAMLSTIREGGPGYIGSRWAWAPLAHAWSADARVRERFAVAIDQGDELAALALIQWSGAPLDERVRAFSKLELFRIEALRSHAGVEAAVAAPKARAFLRHVTYASRRTAEIRRALAHELLRTRNVGWFAPLLQDTAFAFILGDLHERLGDPDRLLLGQLWVRGRAAPSMPWAPPPVAVPAVRAWITRDLLRGRARGARWADHLGRTLWRQPGIERALRKLLRRRQPDLRATALGCFGHILAQEERFLSLVLGYLGDPHPLVRGAAVEALSGVAHVASVRSALKATLGDANADVRHRSAVVLCESGQLRPHARVPWLGVCTANEGMRDALRTSADRRRRIAQSLAEPIRHDAVLREQVSGLLDHPEWSVREGAALALQAAGHPVAPERLLAGLEERAGSEGTLQVHLARLLIGGPDMRDEDAGLRVLIGALRSGLEPWQDEAQTQVARLYAARALGEADPLTRRPWVVSALRDALGDPSESVRTQAWTALRRVLTAPASLGGS